MRIGLRLRLRLRTRLRVTIRVRLRLRRRLRLRDRGTRAIPPPRGPGAECAYAGTVDPLEHLC